MFCIYCNETLELVDGELFCRSGNCYYSKHLTDKFISSCLTDNRESNKFIDTSASINGKFYCVNCGTIMKKVKATDEKCDKCGFEIDNKTFLKL